MRSLGSEVGVVDGIAYDTRVHTLLVMVQETAPLEVLVCGI
jgi:hypothetical protein